MSSVTFPTLKISLSRLNELRAERGLAPILARDWSSFLSNVNGGDRVRNAWIVALLKGEAIDHVKALAVLAGVNAALKQVSLPTLKADSLVPVVVA